MKKFELIPEWRSFFKLWSVRLSLIGSALLSAFFAFPDAMIHAWNMLPAELKALMPEEYAKWVPVAIIVSGVISRVFKQKGIRNEPESTPARTVED